jgi:hypothetical protein
MIMKKINLKKLNFLIPTIITAIVVTIVFFLIKGFPLLNIPEIDEVSYIEITDYRLDVDSRKITESKNIEIALNLTNQLLYELSSPEQTEPEMELIFHLKDGESFVISVNEKAVCANGKTHNLKGDNGSIFIKLTEGVFFFDELAEIEEKK